MGYPGVRQWSAIIVEYKSEGLNLEGEWVNGYSLSVCVRSIFLATPS